MTETAGLGRIEKADLREAWPHEAADFTPWLGDHVSELGAALGLELELQSSEAPVGTLSLDLLARDTGTNRTVIIENQLEPTDHDHLAKLLTVRRLHPEVFSGPGRVRQVQRSRLFSVVLGPERTGIFTKGSAKLMVQTLQKNIRVTPGQWKRIEKEAEERGISAHGSWSSLRWRRSTTGSDPERSTRSSSFGRRCSRPRPLHGTWRGPDEGMRSRRIVTSSRPSCPMLMRRVLQPTRPITVRRANKSVIRRLRICSDHGIAARFRRT